MLDGASQMLRSLVTPPPNGWFGGRPLREVLRTPPGEILPTVYGPLLEGARRTLYSMQRLQPDEWTGGRPCGELVSTPRGEIFPAMCASPSEPDSTIPSPPAPKSRAERRAEWDRLAAEFGAGATKQAVGLRP